MMPVACLRWWFCSGAGMVYASWECQGTNPRKLASLPALGLFFWRPADGLLVTYFCRGPLSLTSIYVPYVHLLGLLYDP